MTESLGRTILETLADAAAAGPYALVDYPNYLNPGDAAIWLGARRALEAINGRPPAYAATLRGFSPARCRAAIGKGTVYFLGGGNFGDLYPRHQRMRLDVLRALAGNPVVQLPMSCAFAPVPDEALLAETRALYRDRPALRLFARDRRARSDLGERFGLDATPCPDLCHLLPLAAPPPVQDVVRLMRRDPEAAGRQADAAQDWRDMAGQRRINRLGKLLLAAAPRRFTLAAQDWVAARKVDHAVAALARGRTVETDRLHAALLAAAIGREVLLHDNTTGKVLAYRETWAALLPDLFHPHGERRTTTWRDP